VAAWIAGLGPWAWVIAGVALIGAELVAPGSFFVWLGLAALLVGVLDGALDLSWQAALLAFAALSVALVLLGRAVAGRRDEGSAGQPNLNRRGHALIGRVFTLDRPIVEGSGRIRVDDSSWRVEGPDVPAGASVRVVGVEGTTLVVEASAR
jgi:membrane protein implicated in regulation of membrane protease activity